jgi:ABC-type lipoprotein export system ATPase subunit
LLVDEPISHLDDNNSQIMASIMMEEAHKQNACVIVTSIGKHMDLPYDRIYKL